MKSLKEFGERIKDLFKDLFKNNPYEICDRDDDPYCDDDPYYYDDRNDENF